MSNNWSKARKALLPVAALAGLTGAAVSLKADPAGSKLKVWAKTLDGSTIADTSSLKFLKVSGYNASGGTRNVYVSASTAGRFEIKTVEMGAVGQKPFDTGTAYGDITGSDSWIVFDQTLTRASVSLVSGGGTSMQVAQNECQAKRVGGSWVNCSAIVEGAVGSSQTFDWGTKDGACPQTVTLSSNTAYSYPSFIGSTGNINFLARGSKCLKMTPIHFGNAYRDGTGTYTSDLIATQADSTAADAIDSLTLTY